VSAYSPRLTDTDESAITRAPSFEDVLADDGRRLALRRRIIHIVSLIAEAAILFGLILLLFCRMPQVDGKSMEPQLTEGEHVLIDTLAYDLRIANPASTDHPLVEIGLHPILRGDLVAFEMGSGDERRILLKRVAALPGDTIAIDNGAVAVNGVPFSASSNETLDRSNLAPLTVPKGDLYVLGDNRAQSVDSRSFGPIPIAAVIGRAKVVLWPLTRARALR
jgi:signal peptidase I